MFNEKKYLRPGEPTPEDKKKIELHPFVVHLFSSKLMIKAKVWCQKNNIDYHFGLPNPMYWRFNSLQDQEAFAKQGFGEIVKS